MAHGESDGADGGAGEALDATNQAAGIADTDVEEDVRDGDAVLPRLLGSAWMKKTTMRSSRSHRQGEGWPVAAVVASGVDGSTRWCCGSEQRRERES